MNINEGQESLKRALLMMSYKLDKTLNENINESSKMLRFLTPDVVLYKPEAVINLMGLPKANTKNVDKIVQTINDAISGAGTGDGLYYAISNTDAFNTLERSILISSKYKSSYGESLGDAMEGEWFATKSRATLNKILQTLIDNYCASTGKNNKKWCEIKPEGQVKYGF